MTTLITAAKETTILTKKGGALRDIQKTAAKETTKNLCIYLFLYLSIYIFYLTIFQR